VSTALTVLLLYYINKHLSSKKKRIFVMTKKEPPAWGAPAVASSWAKKSIRDVRWDRGE
jgi:hypothetical protein